MLLADDQLEEDPDAVNDDFEPATDTTDDEFVEDDDDDD